MSSVAIAVSLRFQLRIGSLFAKSLSLVERLEKRYRMTPHVDVVVKCGWVPKLAEDFAFLFRNPVNHRAFTQGRYSNAPFPSIECTLHVHAINNPKHRHHLSPLLLRLLKNLLDDLLLLNQESTNDTVLDAVGAARTTVGALNGLLWAGDGGVLAWAEGRDLEKSCQTRVQVLHSAKV